MRSGELDMRRLSSHLARLRLLRATLVAVPAMAVTAAVLGASISHGADAQSCAPDTTVQTTIGPVCGIVVNGDKVYLGIPYAAPPIGNLRWAPPQPHAAWNATLEATSFGSMCQSPRNVPSSEACLFLNVWRPPGGTRLPVLFHIHGGGFYGGSGNGDYTLLANTGHEVVVSINYRLGIFGFLAHSALGAHSGDYGLQDQQAALRWVQDNIARFGGDPGNVTLFGQSAGGASVCDAAASPTAAGLLQKGISESAFFNYNVNTIWSTGDCKSQLQTEREA